jgi:hypothetical protein
MGKEAAMACTEADNLQRVPEVSDIPLLSYLSF